MLTRDDFEGPGDGYLVVTWNAAADSWQFRPVKGGALLTVEEAMALGLAGATLPDPVTPLWTDLRAVMPYNAAPDDPWLAARARADWWQRTPADIQRITLHHIGSNATAQQVAEYITRPIAQGGKGLPRTQYHFHVMPDGEVLYLLDLSYGCWHDSGGDHNTGIAIGMGGALHTHQPPVAQLAATARLTAWLMGEYSIPLDAVNGHNEWARQFGAAGTTCPGWTAANWRNDFFAALGELVVVAHSFSVAAVAPQDFGEELADLQRGA